MKARGNGTQRTDYAYNDQNPLNEKNYYRLKIIDNAGKTAYSNTVLVNMNHDKKITFVYPNPANNILHIDTNNDTQFSMLDQSGRIVFTTTINGKGTIDVSGLSAGAYFLKNSNNNAIEKIIIAR